MATEKRLIDANALLGCFEKEYKQSTYPYFHIDEITDEIMDAPTVDAVELPCKIGDDIWWINEETETVECEKKGVCGFVINKDGIFVMGKCGDVDAIGSQYCYLSKEDAETALREGSWRV